MNAKRNVDRTHPDFPEYKRRFEELWAEMEEKAEMAVASMGEIKGFDGPHVAIHKAYAEKIVMLQKEFAHIFYIEDGE